MSNEVIKVTGLVTRFGDQTVHDGLDFALYENEIVALVGGSGSGKSVLLHTILGLRPIQQGEITVGEQKLSTLSDKDKLLIQRRWGMLFQSGALFSGLTILDNIKLPMREHTALSEELIDKLARLKLDLVGLPAEAGAKFPSEISGGMNRRAGLARALALDPGILFLDEPTAGLDPISAAAFDELTRFLQKTLNLTVLIITHDLDTIVSICDRVIALVDKKVVSGSLKDMMNNQHPWLQDYFHGPRMRNLQASETHGT